MLSLDEKTEIGRRRVGQLDRILAKIELMPHLAHEVYLLNRLIFARYRSAAWSAELRENAKEYMSQNQGRLNQAAKKSQLVMRTSVVAVKHKLQPIIADRRTLTKDLEKGVIDARIDSMLKRALDRLDLSQQLLESQIAELEVIADELGEIVGDHKDT
ncbi:MAG: hypothetical protein WCE23_17240 [Candidatus Binatus sp.]|uniref:hypothetical protein n=1 Tax=Candidatus Binatus sp. TaxID=2811406 RepID=UPI003C776D88